MVNVKNILSGYMAKVITSSVKDLEQISADYDKGHYDNMSSEEIVEKINDVKYLHNSLSPALQLAREEKDGHLILNLELLASGDRSHAEGYARRERLRQKLRNYVKDT